MNNPNYLNSEIFFHDENKNPVRVRVHDCLDNRKMGYDYQQMPTPWPHFKPLKRIKITVNPSLVPPATQVFQYQRWIKSFHFQFAGQLQEGLHKRKMEKEELLTLKQVKYDISKQIRLEVFLNVDTFNWHELESLEEIGLQDEDTIIVTLVSKMGLNLSPLNLQRLNLQNVVILFMAAGLLLPFPLFVLK
ncbi:polyphenol oxidase F, chloroplastic-like [Lycium barbarum]|uniref:polyphenol oxidase F, chloroplastic-like n=1 Tax=Lycium barbarum TaxID=112863 RepID=UPI00293F570D|nr:polyphenol oxidase F, chloroplastic-like [Lycium barbarum]